MGTKVRKPTQTHRARLAKKYGKSAIKLVFLRRKSA